MFILLDAYFFAVKMRQYTDSIDAVYELVDHESFSSIIDDSIPVESIREKHVYVHDHYWKEVGGTKTL